MTMMKKMERMVKRKKRRRLGRNQNRLKKLRRWHHPRMKLWL
jgi:hypothetical protein